MIISEKDYLAHHGVDCQKWGVRHGPPYPLSGSDKKQAKRFYKKRLNSGKKESGDRSDKATADEVKKKPELTPEEKKARNKKIAQNVAIGAAVAASVLAVAGYMYYGYKEHSFLEDLSAKDLERFSNPLRVSSKEITLPKGQVFQRISSKSFEDLSKTGRTYVSYLEKDNQIYKRIMPDYIEEWRKSGFISDKEAGAYVHKLVAKTDIKAASGAVMASTWKQMVREGSVKEKNIRTFMAQLAVPDNEDTKNFFRALKDMGYNAAVDLNDQGMTQSPLIVFDPEKVLEVSEGHKLKRLERVMNVLRYKT